MLVLLAVIMILIDDDGASRIGLRFPMSILDLETSPSPFVGDIF